MRFIAISDTHGKHQQLTLPEGDAIIHAGDFCHIGSEADMFDFFDWFAALNFKEKVLIAGNHDAYAEDHSTHFLKILPRGITYLNDSGISINNINIWGSPVQPDLVRWAFGKKRGEAMKAHWDLIPSDTDLLITHTPPMGILDKTSVGKALGCEELSERLTQLEVKVHVFGHIHNSYSIYEDENTKYINASNMKTREGLVNKPIVFDI